MKTTFRLLQLSVMTVLIIVAGCQKNKLNELPAPLSTETATTVSSDHSVLSLRESSPSAACNSGAYIVTLESRNNINGNWEWIWSVQNSNPGNGNNGTVQDLSHWGMQFGSCFNWSSVVSASFSADGITWVAFSPVYASDPSQSCMTVPVLKFDFGTTGSAKSYYKLVVNQNFVIEQTPAYYKSGSSTGCCTFSFSGIGCSLEVDETR
ncbi:MAG: hypothetical protein IPH18_01940 [Chitinophagaceae bacterium]|nr:hypothetical protein [Chitinophagaceae bacterium]